MCLTDVPENRVPFPKPEGYDAKQYELLLPQLRAGWTRRVFGKFDHDAQRQDRHEQQRRRSRTDYIGMNYDYPEADYAARREIIKEHESYQQGLMYFLANDPRVPEDDPRAMSQLGPGQGRVHRQRQLAAPDLRPRGPADGRRLRDDRAAPAAAEPTADSVGMGSYNMDSHNVQRYVDAETATSATKATCRSAPAARTRSATARSSPRTASARTCSCRSACRRSHIAYGSIRMEPVFMVLGQSAATAAALAIDDGVAVQEVDRAKLRDRLRADGQVLELPRP